MEKATLTASLPQTMKNYIAAKLSGGRFSTTSARSRSLVREDRDLTGKSEVALLLRRARVAGENNTRCVRMDISNLQVDFVYFKPETGTLPAWKPRKAERAREIA